MSLSVPQMDALPAECFAHQPSKHEQEVAEVASPRARMRPYSTFTSALANVPKNARVVRHFLTQGARSFQYADLFNAFWTGVQPLEREAIWAMCAGVSVHAPITLEAVVSQRGVTRATFLQICIDIKRTFTGDKDVQFELQLYRLLMAYAAFNPAIGYTQGMNLLAGTLVFHVAREDRRLWLLDWIIQRILPHYTNNQLTGVIVDAKLLRYYVERRQPRLGKVLEKAFYECVVTRWFMTLFVPHLAHRVVVRLWDQIMARGALVLFETALRVFALHAEALLTANDPIELMPGIENWMSTLDELDAVLLVDIGDDIDEADIRWRRHSELALLAEPQMSDADGERLRSAQAEAAVQGEKVRQLQAELADARKSPRMLALK